MTSTEAYVHCGSISSIEGTKKRSAVLLSCGWDHYKSDEEDVELFNEYQGWRNKKRICRYTTYSRSINSSSRVKLPRHTGISSVIEDQEDQSGRPPKCICIQIPRIIESEPKHPSTDQDVSTCPAFI